MNRSRTRTRKGKYYYWEMFLFSFSIYNFYCFDHPVCFCGFFFFCWTQLYTSGHPPFRVFSTWCKFDVCSSEHSCLTASRRYDLCPDITWLRLFQHKIDKQLLRKSYKCFYSAAHVPLRFVEKVLFFVACNQSLAWFQKIKNWTVYKWDCLHVKFLKNMGWFIFFSPSPFPTIVNHSFLSKWFIIGSVFWS